MKYIIEKEKKMEDVQKKIYELVIPGPIMSKQRPRMNTRSGKAYTPTKTKNEENLTKQMFVLRYPNFDPIEGKVALSIIACFPIPKGTSKSREAEMLAGITAPTKKPDWDNIGKLVSDALNKIAYLDDAQIVKVNIIKKYARVSETIIKVEEL